MSVCVCACVCVCMSVTLSRLQIRPPRTLTPPDGHLGDFWSRRKIWGVLTSGVNYEGGGSLTVGVHFGDFCPRGLLKGVFDHGGSFGAFLANGVYLGGF